MSASIAPITIVAEELQMADDSIARRCLMCGAWTITEICTRCKPVAQGSTR